MLVHKGFRYRMYPTPAQEARLLAWGSALRALWNIANEQRRMGLSRPLDERIFPTAFDQIRELTQLRAELPWLAAVPRNVCAQTLVELDLAWQRCFQRISRAPGWKRKDRDNLPICEPHSKIWRIDGSVLRFPKLGSLRVVVHRPMEGSPKTCTIHRNGDQWFASVVCKVEIADPVPRTEPVVALDRGVVNLLVDSDGQIVRSPRFHAASMKRLAHAQRAVSRKKKGSKNREKARLRVARLHRKVARQREHVVQNLSATYAKSHGTVVVEKLQIGNMVRANRGLARGILDAGWGRLVFCLRYKLSWSGGFLVEVPAAYSSQTCHACGHIDAASRRSQASFCCTRCGLVEHADLNAALVLKQRFEAPGNPWCLPVEGSPPEGPQRNRKRLNVARRPAESSTQRG